MRNGETTEEDAILFSVIRPNEKTQDLLELLGIYSLKGISTQIHFLTLQPDQPLRRSRLSNPENSSSLREFVNKASRGETPEYLRSEDVVEADERATLLQLVGINFGTETRKPDRNVIVLFCNFAEEETCTKPLQLLLQLEAEFKDQGLTFGTLDIFRNDVMFFSFAVTQLPFIWLDSERIHHRLSSSSPLQKLWRLQSG